jgi:threonylcarbamoyladenosine tRNA methylthiotransferase MtaB
VAAGLKNQVSNSEKQHRSRLMSQATKQTENEFLNSQIGSTNPVLFETQGNGVAEGYTPNYTRVIVNTEKVITGQICDVLIKSVQDDYCIGELI